MLSASRTNLAGASRRSLHPQLAEIVRDHRRGLPETLAPGTDAEPSAIGLDEELVALSSVHRLVPLGRRDAGGDANARQQEAGEG